MKKETISSLQNPLGKGWRALNKSRAERMQAGLFLAEGDHLAGEALKEGKALALLLAEDCQEKYAHLLRAAGALPVYLLSGHVMCAICDAKTPQGAAALCAYPQEDAPLQGDWLIALDGVQDPGNVGTLLRTMDAAGFHGMLLDEKTADPYGPKALRASMGAVFRVPAARCADLPERLAHLAAQGYDILAGDLRGEPFYRRPPTKKKACIVIGNEGAGISPAVLEKATLRVKLPMAGGAESLNAAVAGSIMMYDLLRERLNGL